MQIKVILSIPRMRQFLALSIVIFLAWPIFSLREGALGSDMTDYLEAGRRLAAGQGYIAPAESFSSAISHVRSPFFPGLFAFSFLLFGASVSSALLVTKAAAFGSLIVLYLLLKRVYDTRTGLAVAALVVTSVYMIAFPVHLYIDQTMAFFMLLSLYFSVVAFDRTNLVLAIVAGVALGAGVLVKELAVVWLPLPLYLMLSVPRWRCWCNLPTLVGFGLGFGMLPGAWWLHYYRVTGEIFLASGYKPLISMIDWNSIIWALVAIILGGLPALFLGYRTYQKFKPVAWLKWARQLWSLGARLAVWLPWFIITLLLSVGLIWRTGFPLNSPAEIPLRLSGFVNFVEKEAGWHPLFDYLGWAVVLIVLIALFKKRLGDQVLFWSFLALLPMVLMNLPGNYILKPRYGVPLYWLGYVALGRAFVLALDLARYLFSLLPMGGGGRGWGRLADLALVALVTYAMWSGRMIPETYAYFNSPYYRYINNNVTNVQEASQWIKENIPRQAKLASSISHLNALKFLTGGTNSIDRWYSIYRERTNIIWPYQRMVEFQVEQGALQLYSAVGNDYKVHVSKPMYVQARSSFTYAALSEQALLDFLQDFEIDYLILTECIYPPGLYIVPNYFADHPAFRLVFSTRWRQKKINLAIHIFHIDRSLLRNVDYPVVVTSE